MQLADPLSAALAPTDPDDRARVLRLLQALEATGTAHVLTIPGNPVPKPRPRNGQGRTFSSSRQRRAERALGRVLRLAFTQPIEGNVSLVALFYRDSRLVVDDDNLAKLVRDSANAIAYNDDRQITAASQIVELDRDNPRTVLGLAGHVSSMQR